MELRNPHRFCTDFEPGILCHFNNSLGFCQFCQRRFQSKRNGRFFPVTVTVRTVPGEYPVSGTRMLGYSGYPGYTGRNSYRSGIMTLSLQAIVNKAKRHFER
eukprot:2053803-Rhodomonas_salina.2